MFDVAIIGCGVIGAAAAYHLARTDASVVILEAENDVSAGTTKANSAILHAGYDPAPGTRIAALNVRGSALAQEICAALDVPYRRTGSLVLAFGPEEDAHVQELCRRGLANGVPGVRVLSGCEARALEPALSPQVTSALYAPSAAIVSPWEYALAMAENAVENGAQLRLCAPVSAIRSCGGSWRLETPRGAVEARCVINAAGVDSARVHAMAAGPGFSIHPCRGEYYLLDHSEGRTVRHVIFQCPTKNGKGVLVAPTVHGNLIVGPNAQNLDAPSTATTSEGLAFVAQMARKSVPSLDLRASIRNFAGVRALSDQEDFILQWAAPGFLDLAGMKSPGLSAAAAVGETALAMLRGQGFALKDRPRSELTLTRRRIRFAALSPKEKSDLVQKEPAYGRVICRCETVTEGEIVAACRGPIPPCSLDGVKRRTGAGMGRCQGGFCGPRALEILCRERGLDPLAVTQDLEGSTILTSRTKQGGTDHGSV